MLSIAIAVIIVAAFAWNATVKDSLLAAAGTGGTVCIATTFILLSEAIEIDIHLVVSVIGWTVLSMVLAGMIRKYVIRLDEANPE